MRSVWEATIDACVKGVKQKKLSVRKYFPKLLDVVVGEQAVSTLPGAQLVLKAQPSYIAVRHTKSVRHLFDRMDLAHYF